MYIYIYIYCLPPRCAPQLPRGSLAPQAAPSRITTASLCPAKRLQKLQSSPWIGTLKACLPTFLLLQRSVFVLRHGYHAGSRAAGQPGSRAAGQPGSQANRKLVRLLGS